MQVLVCPGEFVRLDYSQLFDFDCRDADGNTLFLEAQNLDELHSGFIPSLSIQDGSELAAAILGVWAVAWAARQVINLIQAKPR